MTGTLYAIGVGSGDPELLTLKAVKTLEKVDIVFAASSTGKQYSLAFDIARPHLNENTSVRFLSFPMTRDQQTLDQAWDENASLVEDELKKGRKIAFLTIGDPMLYSTFGYLLKTLKKRGSDASVKIIPGITSFQSAAARTATILAEGDQSLTIMSGVDDPEKIRQRIKQADNAVILKSYRKFNQIREVINSMNLADKTIFASRIGHAQEEICMDINSCLEAPHYLTLLLVNKSKNGS